MKDKDFARFCKHFIVPSDTSDTGRRLCWIWIGATSNKGYGLFYTNRKSVPAHRAMYEHCHKIVLGGRVIHHTCENRLCVNPFHLEAMSERVHNSLPRKKRTHCKRGHELTDGNLRTYVEPKRIHRSCKTCYETYQASRFSAKQLVDRLTDDDLDRLIRG